MKGLAVLAGLFGVLLTALTARAVEFPQLHFEHLTGADGIPDEYVFQILQDRRGFIWFSTTDGLNRYDGYQVVSYRDVPVRRFHTVTTPGQLYEDRRGGLWIGAAGVLGRFEPASGKITRYPTPVRSGDAGASQTIRTLHDERGGSLWLGMDGPVLYHFDPKSGSFKGYELGERITHGAPGGIRAIEEDQAGKLWLGTAFGLVRFDPATERFQAYPEAEAGDVIDKEYMFNALAWDHRGKLWVHVPRGLASFDPDTGSFEPQVETSFWYMAPDSNGRFWLYGGWPGLQIFDAASGKLTVQRQYKITKASAERDDGLGALLPDRDGGVWLNLRRSGGLDRYSPSYSRFGKFVPDPDDSSALSGAPVRGFSEDRAGKIWVSTGRGLNRFDPASGDFTHFQHDSEDPNSLDSDEVYSIYEDHSGAFWVGTYMGMGTFDREKGRYAQFRRSIDGREFTSLQQDRQGAWWVGNGNGSSYVLDKKTRTATLADRSGGFAMAEDHGGNLWFGSLPDGLRKLDTTGEVHRISLAQSAGIVSQGPIAVYSIREDAEGMLWLGTQAGLFHFDPKTEKSRQFTVRDGLPENAIMCALADDLGNIWMSTFQRGMSRLNLKEGRFYNYDASDGLQGNMYTSGSCYRARDGRLYFGGRAGFNAFVPKEVLAGMTARPAVITDFQVNGRKVGDSGQAIWETDALDLSAEQKVFAFEFASLCYFHPRKTRYRFRLDGLEKDWTEADSGHRFARYTGIAPGKYAFRVQASLDGRTWSGEQSAIRLTLPPPWWNSGWSRSVALLTILTLIFGSHKLRVKRFELRERRLRKIVEERTSELEQARDQAEAASHAKSSFLANMSHELRTPLNAILGFSTLLREDATSEKQRQDLEIINRSGEHLLNLINDVLDVAKIEAGRQELDLTPCDLLDLVNDVTEMMGPRAGEKKLALLCVAPHDFPRYVWADAPKLRQVFINLLSNALKYTHEGRVILRLQGTEADEPGQLRLTFEVEDSGIGIAKEDHARIFDAFVQVHNRNGQKGSGLGLTITRKFVELMGGSIEVESTEGQGSIFRVKLPALAANEPEVKTIADDAGRIAGVEAGQPVYRILVVDDEIENRLMLERILQEAGFQVRVAEDGAQGVEAFEEWRPDFIWMDVRMPVMDGIEATRRIRKLEGGGAVKIAAITASAYASERDVVMIAGMDDFLLKPYRRREILGCLARHLGVRYVYHDEAAASDEAKLLEALPENLREDLTEALISLNGEQITRTIGRISEYDALLGERLTRRAARLSYTSILHDLGCLEAESSAGSSG